MNQKDHHHLWQRIRAFPIDDPSATIKFSDKLSIENKWTTAFSRKAIEEYKKFIFLCCISPTGASPSQIIDEVWHLHLTYTENYWKEFCDKTLGKEIHHHPSKGGPSEKGNHQNWYKETLRLYREVFGENAPQDIWPKNTSPLPIVQQNSLLGNTEKKPAGWLLILCLPFLLPFFYNKTHVFQLTGPQFLWFFCLLISSAIIFLTLYKNEKKNRIAQLVNDSFLKDVTIYQAARFAFGRSKAMQAAVVDLVTREILIPNSKGQLIFFPSNRLISNNDHNPLLANLLRTYDEEEKLTMRKIAVAYDNSLSFHQGLSELYRPVSKIDLFSVFVPLFVIVIGLLRVNQGLDNNQPVAYLQIMIAVALVIFIAFFIQLSGKKILGQIFIDRYKTNDLPIETGIAEVFQFVFLGLASLGGIMAFAQLENVFRSYRNYENDQSSSFDAGSSCGSNGGSSCSGGGGCGGCGGGD